MYRFSSVFSMESEEMESGKGSVTVIKESGDSCPFAEKMDNGTISNNRN
jgi:hypothetical protein